MSFKSWKSAFDVVVKKKKFPVILVIFAYFILFYLIQNVLNYLDLKVDTWITILTMIAIMQTVQFLYLVVEEKNRN